MGKRAEFPENAAAVVNAALRSMGDLAFELSPDGVYLRCFGPDELMADPPESLQGKHVSQVLPREVAEQALTAIAGALRDGEVQVFEYALELGAGRRFFEARVAPLTPLGRGTVLAIIRDVHERRLAQQRIVESESWLSTTLRSVADAVIAASADGRVRFMNAAAAELTGWHVAMAEGLPLERVLALVEPDAPWMKDPTEALKVLLARDGGRHVVEVGNAPIRDDRDGELGSVWVLREVTRRVRLSYWRRVILMLNDSLASAKDEGEVAAMAVDLVARRAGLAEGCVIDVIEGSTARRAAASGREAGRRIDAPLVARGRMLGAMAFFHERTAEAHDPSWETWLTSELVPRVAVALDNVRLFAALQRAVATRDDVLAVVSHDLRNLLSSVILQADLFLSDPDPIAASDARAPMGAIRRAAGRMAYMIGDLLDVATLDAGALPLQIAAVSARELVDEVLEIMRPLASQRLQDLRIYDDGVAGHVLCDRERFARVLLNLLSNALKFTPERGTIAVGISIRGEAERREVCFSVRDSGPGIPAAERARVFERFARAPDVTVQGKGLGLYIARRIVAAHGGKIWVEDAPGGGAAFFVTLPGAPASAERA